MSRTSGRERCDGIIASLRHTGAAGASPSDNCLQLLNMTGSALIAVLDSDGCMVHIPAGARTPPLPIPTTSVLTLSIAPDVSSSPRALWLPVNGIQILPPQSSSHALHVAHDAESDVSVVTAALSHIVAFPSRKESAFVVVLCSGVQVKNCLLCAVDAALVDASGATREVNHIKSLFFFHCLTYLQRLEHFGLVRSLCCQS